MIIIYGTGDSVSYETEISSDIQCRAGFPVEIRISEDIGPRADGAYPIERIQHRVLTGRRLVGTDGLVTCLPVRRPDLQVIHGPDAAHKVLIADVPAHGDAGEQPIFTRIG